MSVRVIVKKILWFIFRNGVFDRKENKNKVGNWRLDSSKEICDGVVQIAGLLKG